jgi:hypothetical protein
MDVSIRPLASWKLELQALEAKKVLYMAMETYPYSLYTQWMVHTSVKMSKTDEDMNTSDTTTSTTHKYIYDRYRGFI